MSPKQGFFDSLNNIVLYKYLIHRCLLLTIVFSDIFTSSYPTFTPSHFVQRNVGSIYVAVIASGISSPDIPLEQKTRNSSGPQIWPLLPQWPDFGWLRLSQLLWLTSAEMYTERRGCPECPVFSGCLRNRQGNSVCPAGCSRKSRLKSLTVSVLRCMYLRIRLLAELVHPDKISFRCVREHLNLNQIYYKPPEYQ